MRADPLETRVEKALNAAIAGLALAVRLSFLPSWARAEISPANQKEAATAFQAVDALARQTRAAGDLPHWSNPEHAKVLGRFWDARATLGVQPYRSTDVPALLDIGDRAGALNKTYVLFAPQAGAVPDTAANILKYQDEIVRAVAYLFRAHAAGSEAIADFIKTLPADQMNKARRDGLIKMGLGINEMVTGNVLMLRSPGLRPDNSALLLDALVDTAATFAATFSPIERAAMLAQLDTALPSLTAPERKKVLSIKAAFARQNCAGLCAIETK